MDAMDIDPDIAWKALAAHDARFDGRFFVGVTSTRIYCRPVCRVRTPRKENCRFYANAATAEQAGFRPCLRCRPELAPGLSLVDSSHVLAQHAARMIDHAVRAGAAVRMPDLAAATLPAGGTLKIPFTIERRPGVDGEVEVALELPKGAQGYRAEQVKVAKDAAAGELVLGSDVDGPAGPLEGLRVRARVQVKGRGFEEKAPCPFTVQRVAPIRRRA